MRDSVLLSTSRLALSRSKSDRRAKAATATAVLLAALLGASDAGLAHADQAGDRAADQAADTPAGEPADTPAGEVTLAAARDAYQRALGTEERGARRAAFAHAERLFRQLVADAPRSPALVIDWGNAALGAQDIGRAILAYRRAIALHPRQERAERNLTWVRQRMPEWLPRPAAHDAGDSLFFWHYLLSVRERQLIGGIAFALTVILLAPWGRRQRLLARLAILPGVVWLAMVGSILLDEPPVHDAVVVQDETRVLSADNDGAQPALARPLPAGAEITIAEHRGQWVRVVLADGSKGWVQSSAIENVLPE
jgi:hypothetical protein